MKLAPALVFAFVAASAPALAQECRQCADGIDKTVRINANFQVSLPVDDNTASADMSKAMTSANQSLYDVINRQCDVLANEYKGDCRVVQLNVNTSLNDRQNVQFVPPGARLNQPKQHVNANANAVFEIAPAAPAKP
jgi:hypothetical protein